MGRPPGRPYPRPATPPRPRKEPPNHASTSQGDRARRRFARCPRRRRLGLRERQQELRRHAPPPLAPRRPPEAAQPSTSSKVCPNPVIVQTDWYPEVDHWELYAASDPKTAEIKGDRVVSDLIDPRTGKSTGVKLEIRNGGPATQFDLATVSMYKDPAILMGYVNTDESVQFAKDKPTVAVMAPRETSPQIIMWDPATYPDVTKIADLKPPAVKVRYFKNATYMAYLTGAGVLSESQVDDSYDGKPDAFDRGGRQGRPAGLRHR